MAMSLQCGVNLPDAFGLAQTLVDNRTVEEQIKMPKKPSLRVKGFYDSVKEAGLFSDSSCELDPCVGSRAGQLDRIMDRLAIDYEQKSSEAIDSMIARLEPTIVSVLAVAVGLVLLAVILPSGRCSVLHRIRSNSSAMMFSARCFRCFLRKS